MEMSAMHLFFTYLPNYQEEIQILCNRKKKNKL